jgi:hypothetical protein
MPVPFWLYYFWQGGDCSGRFARFLFWKQSTTEPTASNKRERDAATGKNFTAGKTILYAGQL